MKGHGQAFRYLQTQQTPKPDAQDPSDAPPLVEHSSLWKKVIVIEFIPKIWKNIKFKLGR